MKCKENEERIRKNGERILLEWMDRGTECVATAKDEGNQLCLRKYTSDKKGHGFQDWAIIYKVACPRTEKPVFVAVNPFRHVPFAADTDGEALLRFLAQKMKGFKD